MEKLYKLINMKDVPIWFNAGKITESFDAREMLSRGEHPMAIVLHKASELGKDTIFELVTPFPPMPLIEKVRALGCDSFTDVVSETELRTYFYKL